MFTCLDIMSEKSMIEFQQKFDVHYRFQKKIGVIEKAKVIPIS